MESKSCSSSTVNAVNAVKRLLGRRATVVGRVDDRFGAGEDLLDRHVVGRRRDGDGRMDESRRRSCYSDIT